MEKFERAGVGIAQVSTQYRRKGDTSPANKTCCKSELPQFADNTQQDAHEFLMAILPVLQLPRYQGSVSSVLPCKSCKCQSIKKEVFSCIEVSVRERGVANLENCLERSLAADEVQDWKCTSCSQCGSTVKKLVLEAVPELLIIQLFQNYWSSS